RMITRQLGLGVDLRDRLDQLAQRSVLTRGRPVDEPRHGLGQPAVAVGAAQLLTDPLLLARPPLGRAIAQDEMGEVDVERVRRAVGALRQEAHVAEGAGLVDLGVVGLGHPVELAGRPLVDQLEQPREAVAQIEAAPTAVADVEHPLHLGLDGREVVEGLVAPGQGFSERCIEAALARGFDGIAHLRLPPERRGPVAGPRPRVGQASRVSSARWNRPAWDFSAFARVSNQWAISSKPSSRAVRAMPGYMSVYSWVSPAMAALRLSAVPPIGRPVAGSPTASRNSRWPWAWPVSPSAVDRNTAATSL